MSGRLRSAGRALLPVAVYLAATVYFTWPLARDPWSRWAAPPAAALGVQDILLVMWIMAWTTHALFADPTHLLDGNALYPAPHAIVGSEHLVGNLPLFGPVWAATGNPLLALNVVVFASYVLGALFMHRLLRAWTGSTAAAYCGAVAFAFAPWRVNPASPPHVLSVQYFPLLLLLLDRAATTGRGAVAAGLALGVQALCSYYLGYLAYLIVAAYVAAWTVGFARRASGWLAIGTALAVSALTIAPITIPYVRALARGGLAPDPSVATVFGRLIGARFLIDAQVGRTILVLAVVGALALPSAWRTNRLRGVRIATFAALTVAGFLLAFGPVGVLGGWLAPYRWLAAVVPGFRSFRVPFRFATLASFGASGLAAFAVAEVSRRGPARWAPAAGVVGLAAIALPALLQRRAVGLPLRAGSQVPSVYRWLADHGDRGPLLELPVQWTLNNPPGAKAMYYSTYHWLPLLNGYSGYTPPSFSFLMDQAAQLPSPETLRLIVACTGLRWILVHQAEPDRRAAWSTLEGLEPRTFPDGEFGVDTLYEVTDRSRPGCAGGLFRPEVTAAGAPAVVPSVIRGALSVAGIPGALPVAGETAVRVTLRNDGEQSWPGTALDPTRRFLLRARWLPAAGAAADTPQEIVLPDDVGPGTTLGFTAWVRHPSRPGAYTLEVTAGSESSLARAPLVWTATTSVRIPGG